MSEAKSLKDKNQKKHKRQNGSITVFVTMIMIPIILLNGFIVDMGRVKLYGDQALMVADNYGEAALTNYDNLLKEMYGLFATAQSQEGKEALDQIDKILGYSSFDPNKNTILGEKYDGFMPYSSADVDLKRVYPEEANLANNNVMQTQIGDFMRFRIVQESIQAMNGDGIEDGEKVLEVLKKSVGLDKDADVIDKKMDLDDTISNLYECLYKYYLFAYGYSYYKDYLVSTNIEISNTINKYNEYYVGKYVSKWYDFIELNGGYTKDGMVAKACYLVDTYGKNGPDADDEQGQQEWTAWKIDNPGYDIVGIYDKWGDYDYDEVYDTIGKTCDGYKRALSNERYDYQPSDDIKNAKLLKENDVSLSFSKGHPNDYVGFFLGDIDGYSSKFVSIAKDLDNAITKYESAKKEMDGALSRCDDATFKNNVENNIKAADELIGLVNNGKGYSRSDFIGLANCVQSNSSVDSAYAQQFDDIIEKMEEFSSYMTGGIEIDEATWKDFHEQSRLDIDLYKDFKDTPSYKSLYDELHSKFFKMNKEEEKAFKDRKTKAEEKSKKAIDGFNDEKMPDKARDIPDGFDVAVKPGSEGSFDPLGMLKEVASYFRGTLADAGAKLMLKYYCISYDFGMFTSRINAELEGKKEDEIKDRDVVLESLTGVKYDGNSEYMYGAELEYIYGGYKKAVDNLRASRNIIVGFRVVMNFKATYTIDALNKPLEAVREAGNAIFPGLGYIVEAALRATIVTIESIKDWEELKQGKAVLLDKRELGDLQIVDDLGDFLNTDEMAKGGGDKSAKSDGLKLTYNQYLRILILLMIPNETVLDRTGALITLNINLVDQQLGPSGKLTNQTFFLKEAHTAVESTCSVHLDFAVMPQRFLNKVADGRTAAEITEFGKSYFDFTVYRGY